MNAPPQKWRDPLDLERREGRFELNSNDKDTSLGLLAATVWHLTEDATLAIAICPDGSLRSLGCYLLARALRMGRGDRT